jgi:hypothetical protein
MPGRRSGALGLFGWSAQHPRLQPWESRSSFRDSFFYLTKSAVPHLGESPTMQPMIAFNGFFNTLKGHLGLIDYTTTRGIRINCMSAFSLLVDVRMWTYMFCPSSTTPGLIWTPLMYVPNCFRILRVC